MSGAASDPPMNVQGRSSLSGRSKNEESEEMARKAVNSNSALHTLDISKWNELDFPYFTSKLGNTRSADRRKSAAAATAYSPNVSAKR